MRNYLFILLKFITVTFIQANEAFPKESTQFKNLEPLFYTMGYIWMAILIILFTERYIREVYFCYRKWNYNLICRIVNWIQFGIFFIYAAYTLAMGGLQFYTLYVLFQNQTYSGMQVAIQTMNNVVVFLVVYDKLDDLSAASISCSFFMGEAAHIPPHKHEDNEAHEINDDDDEANQSLLHSDHHEEELEDHLDAKMPVEKKSINFEIKIILLF